jgi:hypothetical protein
VSGAGLSLDFIGVGAARCGTSWIARCLREHPAIFLPEKKELHYFNDDRRYEPSLAGLIPYFEDAETGQLLGEFTPRYMIDATAMERIGRAFPRAKILVMLRDPVDRAFSQWCYFRFNKKKEGEADFRTALGGFYREDYVIKSLYAPQIERLLKLFDRKSVWAALFDDIREDPAGLIRGLYRFLGVADDYLPPTAGRVINRSHRESAAPPYVWTRFVRWLTYSRLPGIEALQRRLMPRVARFNRWLDEQEDGGAPGARPLLSDAARASICEEYFLEDLERTEKMLQMDLSRWKPRRRPA